MKEHILKEYDNDKSTFEDFEEKMVLLISELMRNESIQVHQITGRVKERASLENKIESKQEKYQNIHEITDIVGLRIISYLESDVDTIAKIIENEFIVDLQNSIDKRKLKSDQFGYRSLHYVLSCKSERTSLVEYKRFLNLKFEIQIRSILQHAWAEIEHDLGYKGITSIPDAYKRSFNRLAALLETADLEFDRLKKELGKYEFEVTELIKNHPENVLIDQASLSSFLHSNKILVKATKLIKKNVGCEFTSSKDYRSYIDRFINFFKIKTIEELNSVLVGNEKLFLAFIDEYTRNIRYSQLIESIVIYYFQHFLSALSKDENMVKEYSGFGEMHISYEPGKFIRFLEKAYTITNIK